MELFFVAILCSLLNCLLSYELVEEGPLIIKVGKPKPKRILKIGSPSMPQDVDVTRCTPVSKVLKWVTYKEWENMPGGKANNPQVTTWKANLGIRQLYDSDSGCWQTGNQNGNPRVKGSVGCEAANDGKTFVSTGGAEKGTCRVLVNPGNAAKYHWVEGWRGMQFPYNTVCGDSRCKLRVATYYDSRNTGGVAPPITNPDGRAQAAQVDENGYVYYYDETWQWDNNEYRLLVIQGIEKIEILNTIFKAGGREESKVEVLQEKLLYNRHNRYTADLGAILTFETSNVAQWNRGNSLNFGVSANVEANVGIVKLNAGYSVELGEQNSQGGSEGNVVSFTATVTVPNVEPKTEVHVVLKGTKTIKKDIPYEADVRITFEDGTRRTAKEYGTVSTTHYSNVRAEILE